MEEIYLSGKELGQLIDKPVRTIENWAAGNHIQQNGQGKYGLISAFKYQLATITQKLERNEQRLEEASASKDEVKVMAGRRKLIAEADKEEAIARIKNMEADLMEGKLVDAELVLAEWQNAIAKTKAKFISLPDKLALELSGMDKPEDIKARLSIVIDEALSELGSEF